MPRWVSTPLEILGLLLIALGLGMFAPWLGVTAAGGACVLLSLALDHGPSARPEPDDVV